MSKRYRRKGLSTIITTLIIVTAAVVLGTAVVVFASGIFQSSVEEEAISVTSAKLWGVNSTDSQGAYIVKNTGAKELAIQIIKVRGVESIFSDWYYFDTAGSNVTSQSTLNYDTDNDLNYITINGGNRTMTQATGPVSLKPGEVFVIYIANPGSIDSTDAGSAVTFEITAKQATQVLRVTVSTP
ncbi:MAG: hypothetical protein ACE5KU_05455 [Nitrososphaerales archaeon]